ncbi:hypothetical protein JCGZ_07428 [Jatropha curcas]|uniref:Uncharacterized protein n=1 Tax=Jatropha curcas TaxID=180498 RepID=A0A067KCJ4_JATCU|nr:uncharacterized protein LOC105637901 [Jatropha curcas]KDP33857.1 hypothetical protein JCGZ_07428 [Jatropha curcas]
MAGSKHLSDENVKASNIFERAKEEIQEKIMHHYQKETHGTDNYIDENTPLDNVKAPNVFERAKEEIEALIQTIHTKKESETQEKRDQSVEVEAENAFKPLNLIGRAKEEIEAMIHPDKSTHVHNIETHGRNDDIDENTPIDEIKGPIIFQRAKEEMEALVETIHHPKKESSDSVPSSPPVRESGFAASIGRGLEKVCSPVGKGLEKVCAPRGNKKD